MPTLNKPLLPTVPQASGTLPERVSQSRNVLASLVVYLQGYLNGVYHAIVPFQLAPVAVANAQSPYAAQPTDEFIGASAGASAATTIDLPPATGSGRVIVVKKMDANAHNVVVAANGADLIDGAGTVALTAQYQATRLLDYAVGIWSIF